MLAKLSLVLTIGRMPTLLCLFASVAVAQVPVERQPDLTVFKTTVSEALKKGGRSREVLEAAKAGTVDVKALEKDLLTMDFVEACSYGSFEKNYACPAETLENLGFTRTTVEGDLSFQLQGTVAEPKVTHTNFQTPPSSKTQVFVSKGEPWLQVTAFGEKEYHRVLSYEAGVLVVKLSKDGKLRSKSPKWFAQVRVAIPRLFESTGH